ncbi:MAG TPA: FadR/GntR family transcriptional regulator [Chthoniobacterales bacterium]|nr:FadR/GntR family transcriptional regulator [Chthoniobacterales bacterium]
MPIQPVEPRRLYLQIADQVRSLIAAGEFPVGSRLPAERELAKRFGVSRPTFREALIALEVEGYVDVRPGSGIIVTAQKRASSGGPDDEGPLEIFRARILIEGEIAAEAAPLMKPKDIDALEQILDSMKDEAGRVEGDRQFHCYIASKLGNKALLRVVTALFDQRDTPLAKQFAIDFDDAKTWAAVLTEHHAIMSALAAHDSDQARKAMRSHLQKSHNRWARDLDRATKRSSIAHGISGDGNGNSALASMKEM